MAPLSTTEDAFVERFNRHLTIEGLQENCKNYKFQHTFMKNNQISTIHISNIKYTKTLNCLLGVGKPQSGNFKLFDTFPIKNI